MKNYTYISKLFWLTTFTIWTINEIMVVFSLIKYGKNLPAHLILILIIGVYALLIYKKAQTELALFREAENTTLWKQYMRYGWIGKTIELSIGLLFSFVCISRILQEGTPLFD